ncbi:unnamed protein product, partial [Natator depressus]
KDTVVLGAHNISKSKPRRQKIGVRCWIRHPKYNKTAPNNDITLLQLRNRAELNDWVQPIHLPDPWPEAPVGTRCNVSGWGRMQVNPPKSSDVLRDVALEVMADDTCEHNLTKPYDAESMICAGDPRGRRAALK